MMKFKAISDNTGHLLDLLCENPLGFKKNNKTFRRESLKIYNMTIIFKLF